MSKINFSSDITRSVFAEKDFDQFKTLMFETAQGTQKVEKAEADKKIREIMFEVLGVSEGCDRRELHKAIRRHQIDVFEIIEDTVQDLLVSGWGSNPFFNEFVEMKSYATGDTNEFYTPDETILTVSELSGNHHDLNNYHRIRIA